MATHEGFSEYFNTRYLLRVVCSLARIRPEGMVSD